MPGTNLKLPQPRARKGNSSSAIREQSVSQKSVKMETEGVKTRAGSTGGGGRNARLIPDAEEEVDDMDEVLEEVKKWLFPTRKTGHGKKQRK